MNEEICTIRVPVSKSRLNIVPSPGFSIFFEQRKPNLFRRFWYYVLLGWTWEDVA